MAQFTITVPDDKVQDLLNAFATQYNYQTTVDDLSGGTVPNPESKAQFAKNKILKYIKEVYIAAQVQQVEEVRLTTIDTATDAVSAYLVE